MQVNNCILNYFEIELEASEEARKHDAKSIYKAPYSNLGSWKFLDFQCLENFFDSLFCIGKHDKHIICINDRVSVGSYVFIVSFYHCDNFGFWEFTINNLFADNRIPLCNTNFSHFGFGMFLKKFFRGRYFFLFTGNTHP